MKRRSPWLAFAACALLNGTLLAEHAPKQPRLALSAAASAVEAELEKRGLATEHAVSSMSIVSSKGAAYYIADIEPPILIPSTPVTAKLTFHVEMDGRVTAKQVAAGSKGSRRIKTT